MQAQCSPIESVMVITINAVRGPIIGKKILDDAAKGTTENLGETERRRGRSCGNDEKEVWIVQ